MQEIWFFFFFWLQKEFKLYTNIQGQILTLKLIFTLYSTPSIRTKFSFLRASRSPVEMNFKRVNSHWKDIHKKMNEVEAPEPFSELLRATRPPWSSGQRMFEISHCTNTHLESLKSYSRCERNMIELSRQAWLQS